MPAVVSPPVANDILSLRNPRQRPLVLAAAAAAAAELVEDALDLLHPPTRRRVVPLDSGIVRSPLIGRSGVVADDAESRKQRCPGSASVESLEPEEGEVGRAGLTPCLPRRWRR